MKENFINRTSKTVIAFLAAIVVAGFIPMTQAHAARADASSIRLVNNGKASFITGEQKTEVYYGNFKQTKNQDGSFKTEPIKWRVLKNTNEKAFLLADQNLDTRKFNETNNQQTNITWTDSSIRAWLNGTGDYTEDSFVKDAFVSGEKAAVAQTETADNNQVSVSDDASIKDKVFLLSVDEAMDQDLGFTNSTYNSEKRQAKNTDYAASKRTQTGNDWWLRTQGKFNNSPINNSTAYISNRGSVSRYGGSNGTLRGIRPAMNLDMKAVLFASSADQGKASGEEGADALVENNGTLSDQVKMTLKDDGTIEGLDGHKDFVVHPCEVTYDSGKKEVTIPYKNAVTGDNEYISAVVTDKPITEEDAVVKYYGRITKASDENGASVKINTDGKMESGDHLYVFNEQYNGDRQTDFASGMKEISIPPVSHNLVKTNKVDATCTEDGHEAYWTCRNCDRMFSDENGEHEISKPVKIPAGHDLKKTDKADATCTEDGHEAYWTCDNCHKLFSDENGENEISEPVKINATGHDLKKTDKADATCTEDGHEAYWTCDNCHKLFSDEDGENEISEPVKINATGHDLKKTDKADATCTEDGHEAYWACDNCHKLFSDENGENEISEPVKINATGHDLKKTDKADATCTEDGHEAYWTCDHCHKLFSDENGENEISEPVKINATGHDLKKTDKADATCTEDGREAYWTCDHCHKLFSDENGENEISEPVKIPAKHDLKKTDKKNPTCTEDGHEAYWTCDNCHKLFSDENGKNEISEPVKIPAKHDLKKTNKKNPTCTKNGYEAYWTCDHCHKLFSDANGKNETSEPKEIAATGHKWKKATCTEPMTCAVCKKKSGKATGHKWGAWKVTKKATYKTKGQKQRVCKNNPAHIQKKAIPELKVKGVLLAKMTSNGKTNINIFWNKVNGADGYDVFFANCGNKKINCVKTIQNNKTFKWTKRGLKKHTTYRTIVKAFIIKDGKKKYVKVSPCAHAYTTGGTKNYTNPKKVTAGKTNVFLQTGKTHGIKATVTGCNKSKKLMPEVHAPTIRYISTNNKIATVSKSGLIKAKSKGECTIYAYAVNGAKTAINVAVK